LYNGEINLKYKTQMYLQMLAASVSKDLFHIADPAFETNEKVTIIKLNYNVLYTHTIIDQAINFWEKNVFPKLLESIFMFLCLY